ncbi:Zn-ribbon domain-containing OB-fold protein [Mycolicibacterium setense]|uniref:Zn-ribbon domain-containing OB-fold protein n=1 Tax=Mycolicibacterium setense TaxID=431269 RepID=UPI000575AC40|nr:OB-fold domain-containing protein [Mycolicibacterium setense]KHO21200.1 nucleic-acid-binding protein containing a Zn-ribbon [Mycolicibacterium setense]MCV7114785.1 OB-fold domain-containing protein [Mycolicibacterium setense]
MAHRLAPSISPDTEFFWSGLEDGELRIQRCTDCKALRVPPRPMCGQCQSLNWDYVVSAGRGTVYSFVMPQYPPLPFLQYPYVVALIDLDEGVRIVSNLCDIEPKDIEPGLAVEVFYETFEALPSGDELVLHQFRPATTKA